MRYAVSLPDLTAWIQNKGEFCGPVLLFKPILVEETVKVDGGYWTGEAVLVREDIDPERWQAIMTLVREQWKLHKNTGIRVYESKTGKGGWKRI